MSCLSDCNKNCNNTYLNYSSYLQTRGCDQAICKLFECLENGQIHIGPIYPIGNCGVNINGTVTINKCSDVIADPQLGRLQVNGGFINSSSNTLQDAENYSITAENGIYINGPIYADANHIMIAVYQMYLCQI